MNEKLKIRLEEAISELPDKDRVIIRLHLAGENEELIGKVCKFTQQAASKAIRRITTTLAAKCGDADGAF